MGEKFDAIIVGGGIAGCTAGYVLANAGLEVLLIERGNFTGSKNMTGGRLYAHSLEKVIPGFAREAPIERKVTKERITMMTDEGAVTVDYSSKPRVDLASSYTVLRSDFDRWLGEKCEEAGVMVACGIVVDDLMKDENGKVIGVIAGEDEMEADVVILADGVNSLLAQKLGMRKELTTHEVAVGAKEVIGLPQKVLEDRFNLTEDEGMAWMFMGSVTGGSLGGGFLYTNKESISLGVVCPLGGVDAFTKTVPQMLEEFKQHPLIKPLIKDGTLLEYSGHLVPEGGYKMIPSLCKDGVLLIGDAAGLVINIGYTVRGMDLAVASAEAAAKTVIAAKEKGDFSAATLSQYQQLLEASFVLQDMKLYQRFPAFMENPRLFSAYPEMAVSVMEELFYVDGTPQLPVRKKVMARVKQIGMMNLAKDGLKGVKAL